MCVCPNMKQICFSGISITATVLCFVPDVSTATFYSDNLKFQVLDTKDIYSTVEETSSSKPEDRSKIWNKVLTILQMAFKIFWIFLVLLSMPLHFETHTKWKFGPFSTSESNFTWERFKKAPSRHDFRFEVSAIFIVN